MSRTARLALLVATLATAPFSSAQTQQVCHTRSVPSTVPNWSTSVTIPRFDPALGVLASIEISLTATATGSVRIESQDSGPTLITSTFSALFTVTRPDLSVLLTAAPQAQFVDALAPADGILDFGGPSGVSHLGISVQASANVTVPSPLSDLSLFTGPAGVPGTIQLPISAVGNSVASGSGNLITQFTTQAGATVDVCYTYFPAEGASVSLAGTTPVPGRIVDHVVVVRNTGDVPLGPLDVLGSVDPQHFELLEVTPAGALDTPRLARLGIVLWNIPSLAPDASVYLHFRARLKSETPLGTLVSNGPVWVGTDIARMWADASDAAMQGALECACALSCCSMPCTGDPLQCLACRATCFINCPTCPAAVRAAVVERVDAAPGILARYAASAEVVGPLDPNEKRGGNPPRIRPDEKVVYSVHYENIGTLPAQDVFVRDTIDPQFELGTIEFLTSPAGFVNTTTREVTWALQGIQLDPGESGSVMFTIRPTPGLPPGSQVRNRAILQFETTPPIETNEVVNTIDTARPVGTMLPLPQFTVGEQFSIGWTGSDDSGGPLHYSVFVSENAGPFQAHLTETPSTSALFSGVAGRNYAFFCVARDIAGNREVQVSLAETSTTVVAPGTAFCAGDGSATACPCGNASAVGSGEGCLSSIGTGGRLRAGGTASVASDSLVLLGSRMPNCPALYFQGTAQLNGGQGIVFGDGLLCAGGTLVRLRAKQNVAGGSRFPEGDELSLSVRGFAVPGSVRVYQCWYRNAAEFCTADTFNSTNGLSVTWGP